jgi:hypothetical protein
MFVSYEVLIVDCEITDQMPYPFIP